MNAPRGSLPSNTHKSLTAKRKQLKIATAYNQDGGLIQIKNYQQSAPKKKNKVEQSAAP